MKDVSFNDLPRKFHSVRIYVEASQAYCAEHESDISPSGDVFRISFDREGRLGGITRVPATEPMMMSHMGDTDFIDYATISRDDVVVKIGEAMVDFAKSRITVLERIASESDTPEVERTKIAGIVARMRRRHKLG